MEIEVLLAAVLERDDLLLDIARVSFTAQGLVSSAKVRLALRGCRGAADVLARLHAAVGQQCSYEEISGESGAAAGAVTLSLWLGSPASVELTCDSAEEEAGALPPEEWQPVCQRVAALYAALEDRSWAALRRYARFRSTVEQELDRCEKKADLLREHHPEKAAAAAAQAKALHQVLARIGQVEEEERQSAPEP